MSGTWPVDDNDVTDIADYALDFAGHALDIAGHVHDSLATFPT